MRSFPRSKALRAGVTSLGFGLLPARRVGTLLAVPRDCLGWLGRRAGRSLCAAMQAGCPGRTWPRPVPLLVLIGSGWGAEPARTRRQALSYWRRWREPGSGRGRGRWGGCAWGCWICGASSTHGSCGPRRGSHAVPAPGSAGRLSAGLGGFAAGLPDHPGEPHGGRPLARSHNVTLAQAQGSGSLRSGRGAGEGGARVRDQGSWVLVSERQSGSPTGTLTVLGDLDHPGSRREARTPRAPSLSAPQPWPRLHPGPLPGEPLPGPRALGQSLCKYASPPSGSARLRLESGIR